uniref:DNA primase/polymerase bifunctional N-terminal domain-containing protein n=1 Tax=Thermogemmatispora argillosa TaxID=2045280 RepID=A0A455SV20_9CHLR|nr:hypothetical protein KTA_04720 [Thermogemmatispora argillosa]
MPYSSFSRSADASPVLQTALAALEAGISVVPIRSDGSKRPALTSWKPFQQRLPTRREVSTWFARRDVGIALVTGQVSGCLLAVDFDEEGCFLTWMARLRQDSQLARLYEEVASGYEERTPKGGRHLLLRCPAIGRSRVLARSRQGGILVETREEGAIIIVAPSAGTVHPTGRPYVLLRGGVQSVRTISPAQLEEICSSLRLLDEQGAPKLIQSSSQPTAGPRRPLQLSATRPGDLLNRDPQVTWESILLPKGWELVRTDGAGCCYWRHPGKRGPHYSATTNHAGDDKLHVFSTSAPLPPGSYTKFAAYALLYHGDFHAAAQALKQRYSSGRPGEGEAFARPASL